MSEITVAATEDFKQRAANILDEKCERTCPLARELIRRAWMNDGCIFEGEFACRRLGSFLSAAMNLTDLSVCDGQSCATPKQVEEVTKVIDSYSTPYDDEAAQAFAQMAIDKGLIEPVVELSEGW